MWEQAFDPQQCFSSRATATEHLIVWIMVCDRVDPDYVPAPIRTFSRVMDRPVIYNRLVFPEVTRQTVV